MYPLDADKKEKRGLRKRAKYFVLFGGKKTEERSLRASIYRQAHLGSTFRKKLYQQNVQNYKNANKPTCENISP